jgi:hypothetical protein
VKLASLFYDCQFAWPILIISGNAVVLSYVFCVRLAFSFFPQFGFFLKSDLSEGQKCSEIQCGVSMLSSVIVTSESVAII